MATWRYTEVDSGVAGEEASQLLRRQQKRLERQADKASKAANARARREGALSGALEGMQGEMNLRRDGTIRGVAHDLAAVETFLQRLDITIRQKADEVLQQHADDPAAAQAALEKEREQFVQALPPEAQPGADTMFRRQALIVTRQARQAFEQRQKQERLAVLDEMLARREQDIGRLALTVAAGDEEGEQLLEQELQETEEQLQRAVEQGEITPLRAQQMMRRLRKQATMLRIEGAVDGAPDVAAKRRLLEELNRQWQEGKGLAGTLEADEWLNVRSRLEAKIRADSAAAAQPARGALRRAMLALRSGELPDELDMLMLQRAAADSGSEKLAQAVKRLDKGRHILTSVGRMPLPEAERMAAEARQVAERDPTEENVALARAIEARIAWKRKLMREDPLSLAAITGHVKDRERTMRPLTAGSNAEAWRQRVEVAEAAAAAQGSAVRYLTNEERKALKREWDGLDAQGRAAMLRQLAQGARDRLVRVLDELGIEKPEIAHLGVLQMWRADETVQAALEGQDLIKGGVVRVPGSARETLRKMLARVVPSKALEGVKKTADGIYAKLAVDAGVQDFDEQLYKQAVEMALGKTAAGGGLATWKGRKILLPPNLAVEEFERLMELLPDNQLAVVSQTGGRPMYRKGKDELRPVRAHELRQMHLVPVAAGVFRVSVSDPENGAVWLVDEQTGGPWLLNAAKLPRIKLPAGPSLERRAPKPDDEVAAP